MSVLLLACALPLRAAATGTVSGVISDVRDGSPVANVTLRLGFNGLTTGFLPADVPEVVTDAKGAFRFPAVPARIGYLLRIETPAPYLWHAWPDSPCHTGCMLSQFDAFSVAEGQDVIADAAVTTPGSIEGSVRRDAGNLPVEGAKVHARSLSTGGLVTATTGSDGRYLLSRLPPGGYRLYSEASGQNLIAELYDDVPCRSHCGGGADGETEVAVIADHARTGTDFSLAAGAVIGGIIHEPGLDGVPLGAGIRLSRFDGTHWVVYRSALVPAGEGVFAFTSLPSGSYLLSSYDGNPGAARYANEVWDDVDCARDDCNADEIAAGTPIVLGPGQVVDTVDIELQRAASLAGCLSDAGTGLPLAGVEVIAYRAPSAPFWMAWTMNSATSAADGCFVVDALAESDLTPMLLRTVNAAGYVDQMYDGVPCLGGDCPLESGTPIHFGPSAHVEGFDIALQPGASISGRVRGLAHGWPIAGAGIELRTASGPVRANDGYLTTDAEGRFHSYGLVDDTYFIQVHVAEGHFAGRHVHGAPSMAGEPVPAATDGSPILIQAAAGVSGIEIVLDPISVFFDGFE